MPSMVGGRATARSAGSVVQAVGAAHCSACPFPVVGPYRRLLDLLRNWRATPKAHPIELPGTEHRVIVEIPKVQRTDDRLPRDATVAKGKPIA